MDSHSLLEVLRKYSAGQDGVGPLVCRGVEARSVRRPAGPPTDFQRRLVLFPGAFNPLHVGHRRMAEVAADTLGGAAAFEISTQNVDKPPLEAAEMRRRLAQFRADDEVWFTRAATFVEKARLFAGATFVVGVDTVARIAETRYYGDVEASRDAALAEIARLGCRFLVFGRLIVGRFHSLADLRIPRALGDLCQSVPAERFREDVSSTQLRRAP